MKKMKNNSKNNSREISFESVTLLKELAEKGKLDNLIRIEANPYPIYYFEKSREITDIMMEFISSHNYKCDKSVDEDWSEFESLVLNSDAKPETVIIKNSRIIEDIIKSELGSMICDISIERYTGEKAYTVYNTDKIQEICKQAYITIEYPGLLQTDAEKDLKYIDASENEHSFSYEKDISLSKRVNLIMEVANMIVSSDLGYVSILRDKIFNYCLIKYFTDIKLFEDDEEFNLDVLENFLKNNDERVIHILKKNIDQKLMYELEFGCDEAIEFREMHFSNYRDEISDLLQVVREYVVKPDYLNELMKSLTDAANTFADKGDIDYDTVNKLVDIIPVMKELGSKDVAKAIVEEYHGQNGSDKPKPKRGRKPKLEVVE